MFLGVLFSLTAYLETCAIHDKAYRTVGESSDVSLHIQGSISTEQCRVIRTLLSTDRLQMKCILAPGITSLMIFTLPKKKHVNHE
jgi:hypothetical protein